MTNQVKSFSDYLKEDTNAITFAFGRFNPPTSGHEKLMNAVKKLSRGGTYRIYPSQSQDAKKNPLDFKLKVKFMRKMFPKHARNIMADKGMRTAFDVIVALYDQGYTEVTFVAGEDRVIEFDKLFNKYNGAKGRHGFYQFKNGVKVISAGARDPDAEGVEGMSASKLRLAASDNDLKLFAKGMPKGFKEVENLFNAVRAGMGLKESKDYRKHIQLEKVSDRREDYVNGKLFRTGDDVIVKESQEVGKITVLGANYVMVDFGNSKRRCWLEDIELFETLETMAGEWGSDKLVKSYKKVSPGQEKFTFRSYYEVDEDKEKKKKRDTHGDKLRKDFEANPGKKDDSTDAKRRAQFNKQAKMKDDDPRAYKDAPGDKKARKKGLKPSQYTTKYKQMYGDKEKELEKKKK
jgi:hypothetical protein